MSFYQHYTDDELVKRLRIHDQQAFDVLFSRHWFPLYLSAYAILKEKAAAKDVVQEIFVWVWENRESLSITNVPAYLKAAVRFKVANHIRSGTIRESFYREVGYLFKESLSPAGNELLETKELQQVIGNSVAELPEKCQEIYRLSREECLSNREIATRLGISVKTVENQMTIALRRIRTGVKEMHISVILLLIQFLFW